MNTAAEKSPTLRPKHRPNARALVVSAAATPERGLDENLKSTQSKL